MRAPPKVAPGIEPIELTDEGGRTMDALYDEHRKSVAELFVELSEGDRRELIRLRGRLQGGCC